jgi:hypothetical protein
MATRMQQRRGTASQWTSANPVLNAGEMGWESDTNKFKIGDGTNHWADLDYFIDANSTVNPSFGTSIVFEGATADSYETTLQVTDPTADRTITLPNVTGTVITTGNLSDITNIGVFSGSITIEGATANDFETTLQVTDPTADRTVTFQDASGTVVLRDTEDTLTNKTLTAPTVSGLQLSDGAIYVEGATANDFETTLQFTDPTADRTITMPDATGTVALTSDITVTASSTNTLSNKSISLGSNTVTSTLAQLNTAISDADVATLAGTETLTNKTLTSPKINEDVAITATATELNYVDGVTSAIQTQMDAKAPLASPTFTGTVTVPTPTNSTDAATKAYVDAVTEGLHIHPSAVAATTANITLATDVENGDTLDGITLATGNRILIKNQTTQSENGIYVVAASGAPSRATDFDAPAEIDGGDFVFVTGGTVNDNTGWVQTNIVGTVGTDAIAFTQFSGAGTYSAGTGLTLTGSVFSINTGTTVDLSTAQTLTNKTIDGSSNTVSNVAISTAVSGLGTNVATFLGTPSSANLASAVTDETGTGGLVFATAPTLTNAVAVNPVLRGPEERWSVSATAASSTVNLNILTSGILYYTSDASGNWTLNIRGDGSTTLNDSLATNDSITVVFFATNGATPYYQTSFTIDGSAVTPKWQNGTAPSAGNANSIDIYSYTIVKTGNAAFTAFGSQTRFA